MSEYRLRAEGYFLVEANTRDEAERKLVEGVMELGGVDLHPSSGPITLESIERVLSIDDIS